MIILYHAGSFYCNIQSTRTQMIILHHAGSFKSEQFIYFVSFHQSTKDYILDRLWCQGLLTQLNFRRILSELFYKMHS